MTIDKQVNFIYHISKSYTLLLLRFAHSDACYGGCHMNTRQLTYVLSIAETGNLSAAAKDSEYPSRRSANTWQNWKTNWERNYSFVIKNSCIQPLQGKSIWKPLPVSSV